VTIQRDTIWPRENAEAREIARRRKDRKRRERFYPLLWCVGIGAYVWLLLTVAFA